jgi:hypothetical protein
MPMRRLPRAIFRATIGVPLARVRGPSFCLEMVRQSKATRPTMQEWVKLLCEERFVQMERLRSTNPKMVNEVDKSKVNAKKTRESSPEHGNKAQLHSRLY